MCGRYVLTLPSQAIEAIFDIGTLTGTLMESVARYNIAPTQPVVAIRNAEGGRAARFARWGLVPHWVKDPRDFPLLVNARAETMAQKPAFRDPVNHGRCILPADGYYEWHALPGGGKQPWYITLADDAPMALAGLWSTWTGPEGEEVDTVATITVPANDDLARIHHRMPAILRGDEIDAWLDVRGRRFAEIAGVIRPLEDGAVKVRPVAPRVNSAAAEGPDLIAPATGETAQADGDTPMKVNTKKSRQLDLF